MKAELLKVRALPTPRWCLIAVALCFLAGFIASVIWGLGPDRDLPDVAVGFPLSVASIVFGVWVVGVEYGQKTMRQTLTADPRRGRLILNKLAVIVLGVLIVTVVFYLATAAFYSLGANRHGQSLSIEFLARTGAAALLGNLVYALIGASLALVTASMAGGMTASLVFVFVIDSIISIIPGIGPFSFGQAMSDLVNPVRGDNTDLFGAGSAEHVVVVAALIAGAWLLGFLAVGYARFSRSDVK